MINREQIAEKLINGEEIDKSLLLQYIRYFEKNDKLFAIILEKYDAQFIIYYKGGNEAIYELALKKGFVPNFTESESSLVFNNNAFIHSPCMIRSMLEVNRNLIIKFGDVRTINMAYKYGFEAMKEELIDSFNIRDKSLMEKRDFNINKYLSYSSIAMKNMLDKDCNMIVYYLGNNEDIFKYAIQKGFIPTLELLEKYNNLGKSNEIKNYILRNIEPYCNDDMLKKLLLNEKLNCAINIEALNKIYQFLQKKQIYSVYNENQIFNICKYIIPTHNNEEPLLYPKVIENLSKIIYSGKLEELDKLLKYLYNTESCSKEYLIGLIKIVENFNKYPNLINEVLEKIPLKINEKIILLSLLENDETKEVDEDFEIDNMDNIYSLEDIKKCCEKMFRDCYYKIDNVADGFFESRKEEAIRPIKVVILKLLCNMTYDDYKTFDIEQLTELSRNITDEKAKEELSIYIMFLKFINVLFNVKEKHSDECVKLKKVAFRILEYVENNDSIELIYEIIGNMKKRLKQFYAIELNDYTLDPEKLSVNNDDSRGYIKEPSKFIAEDKELYGENLSGKRVDYIELNGMDYVGLVHILNAYGAGGTIKDFKMPRLFGKSYICLSAISNDRLSIASLNGNSENDCINYVENQEDNITLMFNKFDKSQLVMESNEDLYTFSENCDLMVGYEAELKYMPVKKLINSNKGSHTELVMYREDEKGNYIYPSAILARNNPPIQAEINAAAYLNIPIVYVNTAKYKNRENVHHEVNKHKPTSQEYMQLRELLLQLKSEIEGKGSKR